MTLIIIAPMITSLIPNYKLYTLNNQLGNPPPPKIIPHSSAGLIRLSLVEVVVEMVTLV